MKNTKKYAFTMLELVMVIVVLGILAALAMPRMERDLRQDAADNVLSAIRYTQHLALMDNKTDPANATWQKAYWHLRFGSYGGKTAFYTISTNEDGNTNVDKKETAIDPTNGKYMYHLAGEVTLDEDDESPSIFINKQYGVDSITYTGGCTGGKLIAFDHLGRPHVGIYAATNDFATYMTSDCTFTLSFEDSSIGDVNIIIRSETGYSNIVGQPNS
jgi:prepilin-type N-terminal cleavage/methylation domain-containing protein